VRIPQIQALRALAALLVLLYHLNWLSGGYIGVDMSEALAPELTRLLRAFGIRLK